MYSHQGKHRNWGRSTQGYLEPSVIGSAIAVVSRALRAVQPDVAEVRGIDPVAEDAFWRSELPIRPYYDDRFSFEQDYAPAFALGYLLRSANPTWAFEDAELEFHRDWPRIRGSSRLDWNTASDAVADAWDRHGELNTPSDYPSDQPDQPTTG